MATVSAMTDNLVLLTGASGYLGGALARHYLLRGDLGLVLLVRTAQSRDDIERDLERDGGPLAGRVRFVVGDLTSPDPFADLDPALLPRITSVVHAAAVTRFNAELDLARTVNVEGTAKVVALARRCANLSSFGLVSTVYATGLAAGPLREEPAPDAAGFANAYEWSKWTAERLVADADDLPWRILRVCTVIADDDTGTVSQHNVFHHTMKLCFQGLLPLLPGRGDTPVYLVTSRFAVDAMDAVMRESTASGVYHVAPDHSAALTLDQVLDIAYEQFAQAPRFRHRRIPRPLYADEESFRLLVEGVTPVASGLVARALNSVAPFAPQLYVHKQLDNARLGRAVRLYTATDSVRLVANTCRQLIAGSEGQDAGR
jgi:nucleoside-diphosphate-sugar epimerase